MTTESRQQDVGLMSTIERLLKEEIEDIQVQRVHDRSISIAFPDGRVVNLVLYGPRGKV